MLYTRSHVSELDKQLCTSAVLRLSTIGMLCTMCSLWLMWVCYVDQLSNLFFTWFCYSLYHLRRQGARDAKFENQCCVNVLCVSR